MCQALGWGGNTVGTDPSLLHSVRGCLTSSLLWGSSGAEGLECLLGTQAWTIQRVEELGPAGASLNYWELMEKYFLLSFWGREFIPKPLMGSQGSEQPQCSGKQ